MRFKLYKDWKWGPGWKVPRFRFLFRVPFKLDWGIPLTGYWFDELP